MSHTALQCFRLGCVNECAASGADSHACSRRECPLMSRSGGGERHDGSDSGGRHGTKQWKKNKKRRSVFGRGRTTRKMHHSRTGWFALPVTPPSLSLFLPSTSACSFPFLCLFLFIAHSIISPLLRNTPLHSLSSRSDISAPTAAAVAQCRDH